jgi:hypothetical protein
LEASADVRDVGTRLARKAADLTSWAKH